MTIDKKKCHDKDPVLPSVPDPPRRRRCIDYSLIRETKQRLIMAIRRRESDRSSSRVRKWLSKMSLDDKIGQMSQIDLNTLWKDDQPGEIDDEKLIHYFGELGIGSLLNTADRWDAKRYRQVMIRIQEIAANYSRPPVIWGLDSVHGANYVYGAVVTPQPINLAATFNVTMAFRAGLLASRDTRAAGINWLFSPILGLSLEPKWSRVYETFGEDPKLVTEMGHSMIAGIQQVEDGTVPSRAAACAKHFVGYSMSQKWSRPKSQLDSDATFVSVLCSSVEKSTQRCIDCNGKLY